MLLNVNVLVSGFVTITETGPTAWLGAYAVSNVLLTKLVGNAMPSILIVDPDTKPDPVTDSTSPA
jgi:hypothetical protein